MSTDEPNAHLPSSTLSIETKRRTTTKGTQRSEGCVLWAPGEPAEVMNAPSPWTPLGTPRQLDEQTHAETEAKLRQLTGPLGENQTRIWCNSKVERKGAEDRVTHKNICYTPCKHRPMERINSKELVCNFKRKIAGNHFFPYDTSSSDEVRTINTPNKSSQFEFLHNWEDFWGILSTIPRRDSEGMLFKSKDTFINLIRSLLSSVWWQKYGQSGVLPSVLRPSTPLVLSLKTSCVMSLIWQYWELWIERHQEIQSQLSGDGWYGRFLSHVNREAKKKISDSKLDRKRSVFNSVPKKDNAKAYSNYHTIALISHTS